MIDLALLRILKHKDDFYKVRGKIPVEVFSDTTQLLLDDYSKYFDKYPDHTKIDVKVLLTLFNTWHKDMKPERRVAFQGILKKIGQDIPDNEKDGILETMMELRLSSTVAGLLQNFEDGELVNFYQSIQAAFDEHKRDSKITGIDFVRDPIGDLLARDENEDGILWRLECLRRHMRPLRGGDFGIVAGRPDKGKTTFLASEVSYLAPQLLDERTAVWLNNEGPGNRIKQRLYQAAVGMRLSEMIEAHRKGDLETMYDNIMGIPHRIRVFDIHGMDTFSVERIIETNNTGIVVYDMIDKIKGFGDAARTDLGLEKMYDWARELCVKYDTIGLATSQISAEGDGLFFPTMPMLKDSKTGKQGACDFQLMIGASNEAGYQSVRGIGLVKNKLHREGQSPDPHAKVEFKPQIARFVDIEVEEVEKDEE